MNKKRAVILITGLLVVVAGIGIFWFLSKRPPQPHVKPFTTVGVGLYMFRNKDGKFEITRTFPNSPAEKAGLGRGIVINKVDDTLAEEKDIRSLSKMLTGPVGTKVVLETIDKEGNTNKVELIREQFINHSTR